MVREAGCAIVGQTADLAPADRRLYAVRDATGTVESIPLIVASILSKKLAEGLDALVLDVKTGSGAFMAEREDAQKLAEALVEVAKGAGLNTVALITDMDEVLGTTAGNALEVRESIDHLTGAAREPRLHEVTLALAAAALVQARLHPDEETARAAAQATLDDGSAAERFGAMVAALGGPARPAREPRAHLPARQRDESRSRPSAPATSRAWTRAPSGSSSPAWAATAGARTTRSTTPSASADRADRRGGRSVQPAGDRPRPRRRARPTKRPPRCAPAIAVTYTPPAERRVVLGGV